MKNKKIDKNKAFQSAVKDISDTFINDLATKLSNNINKKTTSKNNNEVKLAASYDEINNLEED